MTEKHHITVIIPTTDLQKESVQTLQEALNAQQYPDDKYDTIFVEDPNKNGPAWARNQGFLRANTDTDILAFTDDDCIPPPNWLNTIHTTIQETGADIVGDGLTPIRHNTYADFLHQRSINSGERRVGGTGNTAYKREVLMDIGVFNEHYPIPGGEDHELLERALNAGYTIQPLNLRMPHNTDLTYDDFIQKARDRGTADYLTDKFNTPGKGARIQAKYLAIPFAAPYLAYKGLKNTGKPLLELEYQKHRLYSYLKKHMYGGRT